MIVRIDDAVKRRAFPGARNPRDERQPLFRMGEAEHLRDVGVEFQILVRPDSRLDCAHVQGEMVQIEIRVRPEPVHLIVLDDAVGEIEAPVFVEEEALPLDEYALNQDIELIKRKFSQIFCGTLFAVDTVPDVSAGPVSSHVDVRSIDLRHLHKIAVHQFPERCPFGGRLFRQKIADEHLPLHSRHCVGDGSGNFLQRPYRSLNHIARFDE